MAVWSIYLANESETVAAGEKLGAQLQCGGVVYLGGTLGAGKTTFCRGVLKAFGHSGAVKSPTYTLVEPYERGQNRLYHFDLYRLGDPEELEFMGVRDYFSEQSIALVEWPSKGEGYIPKADLVVNLIVSGEGRKLTVESFSERGGIALSSLQ